MARDYILKPFRPAFDLRIDYAAELNSQQHAAVTAPPGASLVIAGAGSGKTRTLTYRVAFLLEQGIPPDRILLLTFTNKAAKEMMRRVAELVGQEIPELWGGTFHSIGARILRRNAEKVGYRVNFSILDREDARALIKSCLEEFELPSDKRLFPKTDQLLDILSLGVNKYSSALEALIQEYSQFQNHAVLIERVANCYIKRKLDANCMDFDDLLVLWLKLLKQHPAVLERYQRQFQFILVDEYQDTNPIQSEIIEILAAKERNLMVVGDDSQSIYSWRGANYLNIIEFPNRFPNAKTFKIETNYRSTPEILQLANAAIAENTRQFEKQLVAAKPSGAKPMKVPCGDSQIQAAFVVQRILELRDEGVPLKEIAVLYRSHFHALEIQLALVAAHVPFVITSGIRFFEQAHIKDVVAFLRLITNPTDELAFKRMVLLLDGIGDKAADKLWTAYLNCLLPSSGDAPPQDSTPVNTTEEQVDLGNCTSPVGAICNAIKSKVPKRAVADWNQMCATLDQLQNQVSQPSQMIVTVLEAMYEDYLEATFDNAANRLEDLQELSIFAKPYTSLESFLTNLALLTSADAEGTDDRTRSGDNQVRLSTVHQAKGLEFDVVFVIMLCEGLFPSRRAIEEDLNVEEERRLFYVAVTRARNELYLTFPLIRTAYGQGMGESGQMPSRFLVSLPKELVEEVNLRLTH